MSTHTPAIGMERKLAAIFSTDVAGYSRLMGEDEETTIRTLTTYRALIASLIQQYRGRVVDAPGDNLLAEFASVVDAVRCAVEIQEKLKAKNAELPAQRQMHFRIGINLGDVVVEGERLYGDGVNIAARLESLAVPGGICISGSVHEQVESKLSLNYDYQGEQTVKNIAKPVRVYRVASVAVPSPLVGEGQGEGDVKKSASPLSVRPPSIGNKLEPWRERRTFQWVAAGLVLLAITIGAVWYFSYLSLDTQHVTLNTKEAAPPSLPLPDKPSLIVLPFTNMSGDPEQEYFSDGLTETLTGNLSRISSLFVIARNSAFTYKGKAVKVQDVGREMGVRYVLEGSVQKADQRVRITAQLIEATTGYHLWSEQYDRPLKDIFALQDDIVQKIVTTLKLQLALQELGYIVRKTTDNLAAYDYYLRGAEYFYRFTKETNAQARQLFEQALALDPQYAEAYVRLGTTYVSGWILQWDQDSQALEHAFELMQKAMALNDSLPLAHRVLSLVLLWKKQHDQALAAAERAVALDPNDAEGYARLGATLNFAGRPEEALVMVEKAMRLNPRSPVRYSLYIGHAYYLTGRYEEAITALKGALTRNPDIPSARVFLAATYSELGREAEAQAEVVEMLRISPNFSLEGYKQRFPYKDPAVLERQLAALRKAGLK